MTVEDYEEVADDSAQKRVKLPPAKAGDLLGEKRTMSRRTFKGKPVTAQKLREHAEKYGIDGVAETAAESGMNEESLTALIISLDRINATFRRDQKKKHLYVTPAKKPADRRARELLGIEEPETD